MLALQAVGVNTLDSSVFLWLNLGRDAPEALVWLAMACSRWLPAVLLMALLPLAALGGPRGRRTVWLALLGMGLAWAAAALLKHSVAAPRPFMLGLGTDWLGHSGGNGFPSSHASVAAAFAASALLGGWPRTLRWALALAGALVCWSRIAVGVHFPSDVLAAMLLGSLCALAAQAAAAWLTARRARAKSRWAARSGQTS